MKRGKLMLTVLVVLAMLFASCSSHLSEGDAEGGSSAKTVSVYLGVDVEDGAAQKTITTNTDLSGMTFLYCATHNWTQDRPVRGDTKGQYVIIPGFNPEAASSDLGSFTAGAWTFDVRVMKGSDIIYSGSADYNIYTGHATPEVTVTPDGTGTGSISITVKVPTTGPDAQGVYHDSLTVISDTAGGVTMTRDPNGPGTDPNDPDTYNLIEFTGSKAGLAPGPHTFRFTYNDESNTATDGAAKAVTIFAGQPTVISGLLDGGTWHDSSITINAPGIKAFTASAGATVVAPSTVLTYTASAKSAQGNALSFEWVVDNIPKGTNPGTPGPDPAPGEKRAYTSSYDFSSPTLKMHNVTCVAIDTTAGVSQSIELFVEVGYQVSIGNITGGTIAIDTNAMLYPSTVFPAGDNVHLTVSPANGKKLQSISVNGTPISNKLIDYYDAATNKAGFIMPAAAATVTATFVDSN